MSLKKSILGASALATTLSIFSFAAPVALAQDVTPAAGQAQLRDTVTVTARRREEDLLDVPISVTAATGEQLIEIGAQDITAIQRLTPNATIEVARGSNSTIIAFIRGVGQQDPLWGFEPGVGLYIDDVYVARPQGAVLDILDVNRIEVLRGPQGTLYGRNTIGGAIKYVTNRLSDEPEFGARVNIGSYEQRDLIIDASIPLGETFAVGGAVGRYTRDGFGENLFTGAEHYDKDVLAFRASAEWTPTPDLFFRLAYDNTEDTSNPRHGHRLLPDAAGVFPVTESEFDTRAGIGDDNLVETDGVSLTAEWTVNDTFTFKSITAFREGNTVTPIDFDALPQPDFDVPATYSDEQFSQEFQLLVDSGNLSGVIGLYYLEAEASGDFDVILGGLGVSVYQAGLQEKENRSIYADFTYDFSDRWSLSAGARYTEDETVADVTRELWLGLGSQSFDPSNASIFLATQTGYQGLTRSDDAFTPRFSLSYQATDDVTVYASYSQGFKAGGFDPRAREDLDPLGISRRGFGPETVDSYEAGIKGRFFGGAVEAATAVFLAQYSDQQITVQEGADSDNDGINDTFISSVFNAGESEYVGFEFEGSWYVTDEFTLSTTIGYIDAQIEEILSAGVNIADLFVTQNTPELSARLAANYTTQLSGNRGQIAVNASAFYRDDYHLFNVANTGFGPGVNPTFPAGGPPLDPDAYTLFDASVVWTSSDENWSVALHGRNLSDERYRVAAYNFVTPSQLGVDSAYSAFYGEPRTVTLSIGYRY